MEIFGFDTASTFDYENGYHLTSDVTRMAKVVAHYELYKRIIGLPGHVVELGVFKGASLIRFATFRHVLEAEASRRIVGFDAFGEFPQADNAIDAAFREGWERGAGQGIGVADLQASLAHKRIGNVELVQGDICATLPQYVEANPAFRACLVHVDTDIYQPACVGIELLWERLVPGGMLLLDDYGTEYGGTRAVEEFVTSQRESGTTLQIQKLPQSHASPCFIVKP